MLELVEVTRPRVCRTGGQLTAATTMRMEWDCLKGVVQVYSPVSPSSACQSQIIYSKILFIVKNIFTLTMLSLNSRVESLMGPCAQPCG